MPFVFCLNCIFCAIFSWFLLAHSHSFPSWLLKKLAGGFSGDPHHSWSPRNISKNPCLPFLPPVTTSLPVTFMGHSLALPARVLAVLDLQLYEVKFLGLFLGYVSHSCCVSFIYSSPPPSSLHSWLCNSWGPGSCLLPLLPGRNSFFPYFF